VDVLTIEWTSEKFFCGRRFRRHCGGGRSGRGCTFAGVQQLPVVDSGWWGEESVAGL